MNWDSRPAGVFIGDVDKLPRFIPQNNRLGKYLSSKVPGADVEVKNVDMKVWLEQAKPARQTKTETGVYVIFGARPPEPKQGPTPLLDLPFSRDTFDSIVKAFLVNISIVRAINRGAATFVRTYLQHESEKIPLLSYNIRAGQSHSGDLAMSVTTDLATKVTYVIVYGCSDTDSDQFLTRLAQAGPAFQHPMLLPGLFAEIQRIKHVKIVRRNVERLYEYVIDLSNNTLPKGHDKEDSASDGVKLWRQVSHDKLVLETWATQLKKMVAHVDELNEMAYGTKSVRRKNVVMIREGTRIKERLQDIIADYDELQRKCASVIEGTTLANGTAWNHLARKDSTQMKSIALLTMVFLPATFVATFFAMPLLNWHPDPTKGENIASNLFWIYWVVTAVLTLGTVVLWYMFSRTKRHKLADNVV